METKQLTQSSLRFNKDQKISISAYDELDRFATDMSSTINLGTTTAVAALGYADWRHPMDEWRSKRPALAEWFEEISARPAMQVSAPIY